MDFYKKVCQPLGIKLKDERDYGVGMFFLPQDELKRNQAKKDFRGYCKKMKDWKFLGLERSSDSSGHSWKDSSRLHAMYYAGIY